MTIEAVSRKERNSTGPLEEARPVEIRVVIPTEGDPFDGDSLSLKQVDVLDEKTQKVFSLLTDLQTRVDIIKDLAEAKSLSINKTWERSVQTIVDELVPSIRNLTNHEGVVDTKNDNSMKVTILTLVLSIVSRLYDLIIDLIGPESSTAKALINLHYAILEDIDAIQDPKNAALKKAEKELGQMVETLQPFNGIERISTIVKIMKTVPDRVVNGDRVEVKKVPQVKEPKRPEPRELTEREKLLAMEREIERRHMQIIESSTTRR